MRIYVAGPYGDTQPKDVIAENVRRADAVGRDLLRRGMRDGRQQNSLSKGKE